MGTDQYLWNRAKMHNKIVHWQNRAAHYDLCAPPSAVVFVQDNGDDSANSETHANDGQKEP